MTVDKITIAAGRMSEMVKVYSRVLGIDLEPISLYSTTLYSGRFGKIECMLCPKEIAGVEAEINTVQLRFVVEDVKLAFATATGLGAVILSKPQDMDGRLMAAVRDPDGNSLELAESAE